MATWTATEESAGGGVAEVDFLFSDGITDFLFSDGTTDFVFVEGTSVTTWTAPSKNSATFTATNES